MASDLARGCNEPLINSQFGQSLYNQTPGLMRLSSETFNGNSSMESNVLILGSSSSDHYTNNKDLIKLLSQQNDGGGSTSSYTLASDDSRYNDETRRPSVTEDTGVQNSRVGLVQRSTLAPSASLENSGMMYLLALLLPLVSVHNFDIQWRCTPSAMLRATELFLIHLSRFIRQARAYVRQLARDQIARDLFATAMDIVLVVYAIGFLFLSLYQASIFA